MQAFRVTSPDFPGWAKWVGQPDEYGTYSLGCEPFYQAWGFVDVHVGDHDIVPNTMYLVQGIKQGDPIEDEVRYSNPPTEVMTTPRPIPSWWADVVGAKVGPVWTAPDGVTNFDDIQVTVLTFENAPGIPHLTWVDVAVETPDRVINMADVQMIILAFEGARYLYGDPVNCP